MIETPLRSMINRVLWKAMLTPVLSTMLFHRRTVNAESYSLCNMIPGLSEIRSSVSNTFVRFRYRQTRLLVPVILHPRDLVTRLQTL